MGRTQGMCNPALGCNTMPRSVRDVPLQVNGPGYDRQTEHSADAVALLERLRQANREGIYPSTADLQREGRFGLRPVNRLVDLRHGRYLGIRFDIEKITCGRGVFRWRLHEPARPGYPKNERQTVLELDWKDRPRTPTNNRGEVLPPFELTAPTLETST